MGTLRIILAPVRRFLIENGLKSFHAALKALRDDTSGPEITPIALHLITTTTDQHLHDPDSSSSDSQKKSNR